MGKIDRRVLKIVVAGGFLILATVALLTANDWWLSGLASVSILAWLAAVLAAIYSTPERRPVVLGAVLMSFLYILCAVGPWFRGNVGPWLLTTRVLSHAETHWLGRQPPAQPPTGVGWTGGYPPAYINGVYPTTSYMPTTNLSGFGGSVVWNVAGQAQPAHFVSCGHWLFAWVAAAGGGLVAGWIARRQLKRVRVAPADPTARPTGAPTEVAP